MKLKLDFHFEPNTQQINHHSKVVFTGSCFAHHIFEKLSQFKLHSHFLGNGIVFHPNVIAEYIMLCLKGNDFPKHLVFEHNDTWHSWMHHGSVWAKSQSELLKNIQLQMQQDLEMLQTCKFLVFTFGSSYAYQLKEEGTTVANCHKVPSYKFIKSMSSHTAMLPIWNQCLAALKQCNPTIQLICSVSPVKYTKDGIHENNISKANLLILADEICQSSQPYYFPAFEILQDELRDYRFYDEDFSHPNTQAIDYIFSLFKTKCIDQETQTIMDEIQAYNKLSNHRILHNHTKEHEAFESKKAQVYAKLKLRYPHLNW